MGVGASLLGIIWIERYCEQTADGEYYYPTRSRLRREHGLSGSLTRPNISRQKRPRLTVLNNTCCLWAKHRRWLSPHQGISKDKLTPYFRAFQLRRKLYRKSGDEALKYSLDAALW